MDVVTQLDKYNSLIENMNYFILNDEIKPLSIFLKKNRCEKASLVERISSFVNKYLIGLKITDQKKELYFNAVIFEFKTKYENKFKKLESKIDFDFDKLYILFMNTIFLENPIDKINLRDLYIAECSEIISIPKSTDDVEIKAIAEHKDLMTENKQRGSLCSSNISSLEAERVEVDSLVVDVISFLTDIKQILELYTKMNKPDRSSFYSKEDDSICDEILLSFFCKRNDQIGISIDRYVKSKKGVNYIEGEKYLKFQVSRYNFIVSDLLVILFLYEYFHNQYNTQKENEIFTYLYCNYKANTSEPVILKLIDEIAYRKRRLFLSRNLADKIRAEISRLESLFDRIDNLKYYYIHESKFSFHLCLESLCVNKLFEKLMAEEIYNYFLDVPYNPKEEFIQYNLNLIQRLIVILKDRLHFLKSKESYEKIERTISESSGGYLGFEYDTFFKDVIFENMSKFNESKDTASDCIFNYFVDELYSQDQSIKDKLLLFLEDSGLNLSDDKKKYIAEIKSDYKPNENGDTSLNDNIEVQELKEEIYFNDQQTYLNSSLDSCEDIVYEHEIYNSTFLCSYDIHPRILKLFKPSLNLVEEFPELIKLSYAKQYWYKMSHDFALVLNDICIKFGHEGVYRNKSGIEQTQYTLPVKIVHDSNKDKYEIAKIVLTFDENTMYHRHITTADQTQDIESNLEFFDDVIHYPELGSDRLRFDGPFSSLDQSIQDCPDGSFIDIDRSTKHILCVCDPKNSVSFFVPIIKYS